MESALFFIKMETYANMKRLWLTVLFLIFLITMTFLASNAFKDINRKINALEKDLVDSMQEMTLMLDDRLAGFKGVTEISSVLSTIGSEYQKRLNSIDPNYEVTLSAGELRQYNSMEEIYKIAGSDETDTREWLTGVGWGDPVSFNWISEKLKTEDLYIETSYHHLNDLTGLRLKLPGKITTIYYVEPIGLYLEVMILRWEYNYPDWLQSYNILFSLFWFGLLIPFGLEHLVLGKNKKRDLDTRWIPSVISIVFKKKPLIITLLLVHIGAGGLFLLSDRSAYDFSAYTISLLITLIAVEFIMFLVLAIILKPRIIRGLFASGVEATAEVTDLVSYIIKTRRSIPYKHYVLTYKYRYDDNDFVKTESVYMPDSFQDIESGSNLRIYISPKSGRKSVIPDSYFY